MEFSSRKKKPHLFDKMTMLQQYTYVCASHPLQWAAPSALDMDVSEYVDSYRDRRGMPVDGMRDAGYEVAAAIERGLLDIPRQHTQRPRHALSYFLRDERGDD